MSRTTIFRFAPAIACSFNRLTNASFSSCAALEFEGPQVNERLHKIDELKYEHCAQAENEDGAPNNPGDQLPLERGLAKLFLAMKLVHVSLVRLLGPFLLAGHDLGGELLVALEVGFLQVANLAQILFDFLERVGRFGSLARHAAVPRQVFDGCAHGTFHPMERESTCKHSTRS